jgi:HD-like signal output (HDOD) protein
VNLDELSELIEKDTTILAKVITVANTVAHNPGIAPVATISQAIHQIGFHRIRSLALSDADRKHRRCGQSPRATRSRRPCPLLRPDGAELR